MTEQTNQNPYVTPPLTRVFLKTALPIILMMVVKITPGFHITFQLGDEIVDVDMF